MLSNNRVLILEDDNSTRLIVSKSLVSQGLEAIVAKTLAEANDLIKTHSFSLFLLDVHLPDGHSLSLVRKLRQSHPLVPVLVMTGDYEQNCVSEFFELGVRDFIRKPVHPILLASRVKSFISAYETESALFAANEMYQRIAHEKEQEEALAHYVYNHILEGHTREIKGLQVSVRSSARFCGDILLSAKAPNGSLIVMLADATGHGMAAALTIYPLVSAFSAMVAKGLSLGAILKEISTKHNQSIPQNRFVAAILLELSPTDNLIRIWNGGMPSLLMFDQKGNINKVASKNVAIGILPDDLISTKMETFALDSISKIALFSDGLIENKEIDGRIITFNEAYDLIAENLEDSDAIISRMHAYESFASENHEHDDMTLAILDVDKLRNELNQVDGQHEKIPGGFAFSFDIKGAMLKNEKFAFNLAELLETYGFNKGFCQKTFTIITELLVNSIDHGILNIPSELKEEDFIAYLSIREEKQAAVGLSDKVSIDIAWNEDDQTLTIKLSDSGEGYVVEQLHDVGDTAAYGRGLRLISSLCKEFAYDQKTNTTHVTLEY